MKVTSCCCFDLRTGGLVIAGIEAFSGLLALKTGPFMPLIKFTIAGCLVFGILKNVSACLIPYLTEQIISVAGSVGSLIYIGYKFYSKPEDVNKFFSQFIFNDSESDDMKKIIYIAIVLVILLSIEGVYSWIVIFTLYKEISASGHKVQDTIILDNYPQNGNLSFNNNNNNNNFATNTNLSLGDYPPPLGLSMNPSSLNVGINSYPSNLHQNQGNNAPDALAFTYN